MSGEPSETLDRLQRWMQAMITRPAEAAGADPAAVLTRSAALSAAERLAIYQYSYSARLLGALREMFPALLHAMGEPLFDRFGKD